MRRRWLAWQFCYLEMHPSTHPPLRPSFRDESPSLFSRLINKINHFTKALTLVGVAANDGILCLCVNQCLFVVTAAQCQCWWWVCFSLLRFSCCTSGGSTPALKPHLMTSDPAPRLLNTLDLDQKTSEQNSISLVLLPSINTTHKLEMQQFQYMTYMCKKCYFYPSCVLRIWSDEWEEATLALLRCEIYVCVHSSKQQHVSPPLQGSVQCSKTFSGPWQTFLLVAWISFLLSICTKCDCNIVQ